MSYYDELDEGISIIRIFKLFIIALVTFFILLGGGCAVFGGIAQNKAKSLTVERANHLSQRVDEATTPTDKLNTILREYCNLPIEAWGWSLKNNPFISPADELWSQYWTADISLDQPTHPTFSETVLLDGMNCYQWYPPLS